MAQQTNRNFDVLRYDSGIVSVSDGSVPITLPDFSYLYPHNFMSIEFFSDATGTAATPTGGTVTLQAKLVGSATFANLTDGSFGADAAQVGSFSGNPSEVQAVLASVVGATHCRVTIVLNAT